jgi:dipeptidyl aminopeptidase/acylaminoacyl peptidase
MLEINVKSTLDGSLEPNLFYCPENANNVPLVVGLHTWSAERDNQVKSMLPFCQERGWALLLPEFRGANLTRNPRATEACGSKLARQDVVDAVEQVLADYPIDPSRIFVLGGSGGGHMALMMAGYTPEKWFAVSSWCPITDVALWHRYQDGKKTTYAAGMRACCSGIPGDSETVDTEYGDRSPVSYVSQIAASRRAFVHHGRFDISVPYEHTTKLFNLVEAHNPENFFCEIFDGGHEIHYDRAFSWFDKLLEKDAGPELTG